jgi:AMIN domain-containing protein
MNRSLSAAAALLLWAGTCFPAPAAAQAQAPPSIRRVQVLHGHGQVEIEIEASERIVPQANVITGPDRLILDFVNARPSAQLRNQTVSRGEVKSLRVGLFSSNPPVTRIVVDLNGPQPYKVFPSGRTVIVKVGNGGDAETAARSASGPVLVNSNYPSVGAHLSVPVEPLSPPPPPKPSLEVSFRRGMLSISSNKANLSEVLFAVHQQTGAEIAIPAGAEQEQVVAEIGPAPAPEVLSQLLNGSKFNFLIMSSPADPQALDRVILSSRPEGPMPPPPPQRAQARVEEDTDVDTEPKPTPPAKTQTPAADKSDSAADKQAASPDASKPAPSDTDNPPN